MNTLSMVLLAFTGLVALASFAAVLVLLKKLNTPKEVDNTQLILQQQMQAQMQQEIHALREEVARSL